MNALAAQTRVQQALELLGRASQDWRNGTAEVPGALHWPVAIHHARKRLQDALEAMEPDHNPAEALIGMAVYNGWTRAERAHWHDVARSAVPADAWRAFRSGGVAP